MRDAPAYAAEPIGDIDPRELLAITSAAITIPIRMAAIQQSVNAALCLDSSKMPLTTEVDATCTTEEAEDEEQDP